MSKEKLERPSESLETIALEHFETLEKAKYKEIRWLKISVHSFILKTYSLEICI